MPEHRIQTTVPTAPTTPDFSSLGRALQTPSGLMLISCLGILAVLALVNPGSKKAKLATSRWAKTREKRHAWRQALCQLKARDHNKVALSIGPPGDHKALHLPDVQRGIALIGAPGTGKTFGAVNPLVTSALLQELPVILYDFKYPKQAAELAPLAKHLGYDVHIFAPGFPESEVCNPLEFMEDENDVTMARQLAKVFSSNAARGSAGGRTSDDFFSRAGEQIIVAGLSLAKSSPYPDLAMVQAILRLPDLAERLKQDADSITSKLPLWSLLNFDQLMAVADSEKTAASIIGTATGHLTRLMAPTLLGAFMGKTTLPLDLNGRQLIVIGMDKERRDAIAPLMATVLHLLIVRNVTRPRTTPLVTVIDELPTIYLPSLVQWINEYREQGLCLMLGFQNLAQLETKYDRATARAIFGACATKLLFNPGETESARVFSDYLGDEEVRYTDVSRSRGGGKTSISCQLQRRTRKLFEPGEFLGLPTGNAVLISPGIANKRRGSLPVQLNIRVPPITTRMIASSQAAWPRLRALLVARSRGQHPQEADLQARMARAKSLLPAPADGIL